VSTSKPKLLFICQTLPYPPDSGVALRTFNVLRLLSRHFDITGLCFYRKASHQTVERLKAAVAGLSRYACVKAFEIPQEHSLTRLLMDHVRSVLHRRPYTFFAHRSADLARDLAAVIQGSDFAVAHLDSLDLSAYVECLSVFPTVCVHHNVESRLLHSRAAGVGGPLASYVRLQSRLTQNEEERFCPQFAANVVVSEEDRRSLGEIAPHAIIKVVPNGVDTAWFQGSDQEEKAGVVFVGGYGWHPNRDGMAYFCSTILPLIRAKVFVPITWIGSAPEGVREQMKRRYGIMMTGYVEDIRPIVDRAACVIVPLRLGGGTRLKILDAWAMGKAVVSTRLGAEGLQAEDGKNILLRDSPESFADAVTTVIGNGELRRRLETAARATAVTHYDWEALERPLLQVYQTAIADARRLRQLENTREP
jgi:polysaccharide biosynthesis protein PslH